MKDVRERSKKREGIMKINDKFTWIIGCIAYVLILVFVGLIGPTFGLGRGLWFVITAGLFFSIVASICYALTFDAEDERWIVL